MLLAAIGTGDARGQTIRLPLDGYYRPGKAMPVIVEAGGSGAAPLRLVAVDAVPVELPPTGVTGPVPLLVLGPSADAVSLEGRGIDPSIQMPLRALAPDQRLIGIAGSIEAGAGTASVLFPDRAAIVVPLDPARPVAGPISAWDSLDAIVLDSAAQVDPKDLPLLLAAGITVAVRAADAGGGPPDDRWPWERWGDLWLLRHELAGPSGAVGGEAVYLPTQAWRGGAPAELRRSVVVVAVIVSLLVMSALLVRSSRRAIVAIILVAVLCATGIETWRRVVPAIAEVGGAIVVRYPRGILQQDDWRYLIAPNSPSSGQRTLHDGSFQRPIVADARHRQSVNLRLTFAANGAAAWAFELGPNARLAFLTRAVTPAARPQDASTPVTSPLNELARHSYLTPASRITGQQPSPHAWPTVVLEKD